MRLKNEGPNHSQSGKPARGKIATHDATPPPRRTASSQEPKRSLRLIGWEILLTALSCAGGAAAQVAVNRSTAAGMLALPQNTLPNVTTAPHVRPSGDSLLALRRSMQNNTHAPTTHRSSGNPAVIEPRSRRQSFNEYTFQNTPNDSVVANRPLIFGGLWLGKKDGTFDVRDDNSAVGRNPSVIALLKQAHREHPEIADFPAVFACTEGFEDVCKANAPAMRIPGAVALAIHIKKSRVTRDPTQKIELIPDNVWDHWAPVGIPNYGEMCRAVGAAGLAPGRKNLAAWVGNMGTNPMRSKLGQLASAHPEYLEVADTGDWKAAPKTLAGITVSKGQYISLPSLVSQYGYLIDMAGRYASFRLKVLYHSGRPLLVHDREFIEFWSHRVEPYIHYVPVSHDLHDLVDRIRWLQEHPDEADRIGQNARAFAQANLTRRCAIDRWTEVLKGLPRDVSRS